MKIYTKTGDKGITGYIGGRLSKSNLLFDVLGDLDELNSALGIVIARIKISQIEYENKYSDIMKRLLDIQKILFSIGAILSGGNVLIDFSKETSNLEKDIDSLSEVLEPITNFILPGGSNIASLIHFSRAVCRRVERKIIKFSKTALLKKIFSKKKYNQLSLIIIYINRLSDWLFTFARYFNFLQKTEEIKWSI